VQLVLGAARFDVIVIDEAAQLPVPMLRALVETHAGAHLCFSTTTHGYEGTGRGFSLRFLTGLERDGPLVRLSLTQPIRWDDGDPLERLVFDALLLAAEPASLDTLDGELEPMRLDRDVLAADEASLGELFGLLVHAHYRTTPSDLHRLLDAPNLTVHVLRLRGHIVAATIVAHEGSLPDELCDALLDGRRRIRAHALAELLVAHLGKRSAGSLRMLRSVRVATHPQLRRRGLARMLVEHVHREHGEAELFGTVFGATAELLAFRRRLGYQLVRVSASRGARTGEPSVLMLRPVSERAHELVAELRAELARDLPRVLELLHADGETLLDPHLASALVLELPAPAPLSPAQCRALIESYAFGPRTFESIAFALACFVAAEPARLQALTTSERALIEGRVIAGHGWRRVTDDAGLASVPAAMRALRRAVRRMLE
jgi:tRNA(Met) cytidine acetyltransferase